ncbi:MAG: cytochrome b N-terminal domain-containing protein [Myxococcales bacterium]|jgi:quinol-cytochrome oxidoreductase complex cytochrome b subunit
MAGRLSERAYGWLDRRFGLGRALDRFLNDPVPERGGWWYTFGAAIFVLFLLQAITGFFLLFYYEPSVESARESVIYIQEEALLGWAVRGFHYWNMVVLVALVGIHLLRTFISAAYKAPRELNWVLGVLLLLLMVATAYTGVVLRWDRAAYFDLVVGLRIAEYTPIVGPWMAELWRGGEVINPYSLLRTYVFHIFFFPLALLAVALVHVGLVVLLGQYGSWINYEPDESGEPLTEEQAASRRKLEGEILNPKSRKVNLPSRTTFFYPFHLFKEAVVTFGFFLIDVVLLLSFAAPIEGPIDPATTEYAPASIWFFLFFDQALLLFAGSWFAPAANVVPLLVVLTLALWPWLDTGPEIRPARRLASLAFMLAVVAVIFTFSFLAASRVYNFEFINNP